MRRLVYMLLAVALSSGTGATAPIESEDIQAQDETIDLVDGAMERRGEWGGLFGTGDAPSVLVKPAQSRRGGTGEEGAASIIVDRTQPFIAEISNLQMRGDDPDHTITGRLLEAALRDCRNRGDLKVRVDLPFPLDLTTRLCSLHQFGYSRSLKQGGREVHEFYTDLYTTRRGDASVAD
jgi:hypothetical protein